MWRKLLTASAALSGLVRTVGAAYMPTISACQGSPMSTISWTPCPDIDSTQCAFFDVPMDYTNPESNSTVSIFMRKLPATAPKDQRLGSILVNPGGPGDSGALIVAALGNSVSTMVEGRYDIIGFDPRAVSLTGPPTACHDTEYKFAQRVYQLNMQGAPFPHTGGAGETAHVAKLAAIQASHYVACIQNGNQDMLRNSGTVAVAKDMERIVEALGEDGLNYIGYSYGTILGATFAAMRPDLVKRMVLDGVSDAEAYFNDVLEWGRNAMQETNKTLEVFISTCIDAGPPQCVLAATRDNKPETVEGLTKRLDTLYTRLGKEPLVVGDSLTGPGIVQASDVQMTMLSAMYNPQSWPSVAQVLVSLEQEDGREFYPAVNGIVYGTVPEPYTQNVFNRSMPRLSGATRESLYPILCGDTARLNITIEQYAEYFREMGNMNSVAEQWALIIGGCREWPWQAVERYTEWKSLKKTRLVLSVLISFPILFVSLDADPVTPLASAVKMNRAFGNESSTLLTQEGYGHSCSAHPSLCTAKHIISYLVNGTVPKNGTHCTPESGYIYPTNSTQSKRSLLNKRDKELLDAVEMIGHFSPGLLSFRL